MLSRKYRLLALSAAVSATLAAGCTTHEKPYAPLAASPESAELSADDALPAATPRSREPNPSAIIRDPWRSYSALRENMGR